MDEMRRDTADKFRQIIFIVEYLYISFICILVILQYKPNTSYYCMYYPLLLNFFLAFVYCFILYIFSGGENKPTIVELALRYFYLIIAGWLLAKTDNTTVQVIIILPTIIMALRYPLKYTVMTATLTSIIFLIAANLYQHYEFDYQVIFLTFIWMIGLLVNSSVKFERQMRDERIKINEEQKLAAIGQMATGIAHEIRNPLTTIKGFVQLLMRYEINHEGSVRGEYLKIIDSEIERLNDLLNELIQFAKPIKPKLVTTDINKLINEMRILLESQCFNKDIELVVNSSLKMPEILCDDNQIKQVIINVSLNSIDAMKKSTKKVLQLGTFYDLKNIYIKISDSGLGIKKEIIEKLFEPFFTTKEHGTGLGLSVCNTIIQNHGGLIQVSSSAEKGTEFLIILPRESPTSI